MERHNNNMLLRIGLGDVGIMENGFLIQFAVLGTIVVSLLCIMWWIVFSILASRDIKKRRQKAKKQYPELFKDNNDKNNAIK